MPTDFSLSIVREVFERYAAGESIKELCADMNTRGIRTGYGRKFVRSSFQNMLRNRRYLGEHRYMCYISLYPLLNGEKSFAGVMLPGHDIELTIPYQNLEIPWSTQELVKLETERTQIVLSLYPVKKTIVLNEG